MSAPQHSTMTAEEAALERRRQRRSHQTPFNLVIATIASLGIVLFLVLVVVRPDPAPRQSVDVAGIAADAQTAVDGQVIVPALPADWVANAARLETVVSVPTWYVGFITPAAQFIAFNQGFEGDTAWRATVLREARETGTVRIDGIDWAVFDRRDANDPGNHAYAMAAETPLGLVVLHGTAQDSEFEALAAAIARQVR